MSRLLDLANWYCLDMVHFFSLDFRYLLLMFFLYTLCFVVIGRPLKLYTGTLLLFACHQYMERLSVCTLFLYLVNHLILNNIQLIGRISITIHMPVSDRCNQESLLVYPSSSFFLLSFARRIRPTSLNIDKDVTWLWAISINHTIPWMTTDFETVMFVGVLLLQLLRRFFVSQSTVCSV